MTLISYLKSSKPPKASGMTISRTTYPNHWNSLILPTKGNRPLHLKTSTGLRSRTKPCFLFCLNFYLELLFNFAFHLVSLSQPIFSPLKCINTKWITFKIKSVNTVSAKTVYDFAIFNISTLFLKNGWLFFNIYRLAW